MPKTTKSNKKVGVKAWAVLNDDKEIIAVEFTESRPRRFCIGTWQFDTLTNECIPVLITPITKAK